MTSLIWDEISLQIKQCIYDQKSLLSQFPPEAASITTREVVLSLHADCACKKADADASIGATAPVVVKKSTGRHGNPSSNDIKLAGGSSTENNKQVNSAIGGATRYTVKLDTDADVQWVMQAVNYGLTMSPDYWDIVSHSVHICAEWLSCLLPAQKQSPHLPHALLANPVLYAQRLLFSLCRFFAPRAGGGAPQDFPFVSPDADPEEVFSMIHQKPREPVDVASTGSLVEILKGVSSTVPQSSAQQHMEDGRWLQDHYLPLATIIIRRVELILGSSHLLTTQMWDTLLQFGLAVCHSVLTLPPQTGSGSVTTSRPFSQHPVARGLLQLDCLVLGMLVRVWIRALSQHYPSPHYWRGLEELTRVARHRVALGYIWSRMLVVFTHNLLRSHIADRFALPPNERRQHQQNNGTAAAFSLSQFTAYQPLASQSPLAEIPEDVARVAWFRILHLIGNPVDLCHPDEITHTAIFEHYRRYNASSRCRFSVAFLPSVFHQMMRSLSIVVDLFLGISPSLSGCLSTFIGIPTNLYGPVDVTEHFQYASIRAPDTIFAGDAGRQRPSGDNGPGTSVESCNSGAGGDLQQPTMTSLATMVRTAGLSSSLFNPQTLADVWLRPDFLVSTFYNKPEVAHLLSLIGPWLFEASISGTNPTTKASPSKEAVMISERSLKVDGRSYQVGRAEAMACLCRIFIYARRPQLSLRLLTRFYVCLLRAITVDPEVEYVLSTVLLHSTDLLRANLEATTVLLPTILNACQWILEKKSITRPEFVSMTLLRRASLHQLISMVCLPNQFEGLQFQEISPYITNDTTQSTTRALRARLGALLCGLLAYETDSHNLWMLLSGTYALTIDMIAVELAGISSAARTSNELIDAPTPNPDTSSGMYALLLDKICTALPRWMTDVVVANFALEILSDLANAPVPHPSLARCRRCIRSVCAFIEIQCRREKKDHTRALHSLIVRAFRCLSTWLVAHPDSVATSADGQTTLRAVVETIKLGIFGASVSTEAPSTPNSITMGTTHPQPTGSQQSRPSSLAATNSAPMPFSKRVNEAAEKLLSTLFLTVGAFPVASGPATLSCRLREADALGRSTATAGSSRHGPAFQHYLTTTAPEVIVGVAEGPLLHKKETPTTPQEATDAPAVLTFITDAAGRYLWSWKPRFLPQNPLEVVRESSKRSRAPFENVNDPLLKSCIDTVAPKRCPNSDADSPFFPRTSARVPLVKAENVMPKLANSILGQKSRMEVDKLKTLIAAEAYRNLEVGRKTREARFATAHQSPTSTAQLCKPMKIAKNIPSSHILLSHLGYVPVNSVQPSSDSFHPAVISFPTTAATSTAAGGGTGVGTSQAAQFKCRNTPLRFPGTKGTAGSLDATSLIPALLMPVGQEQVIRLIAEGPLKPRETATLFVFYVSQGQTNLTQCIANMNRWSELPNSFHSFMLSLGWPVVCDRHLGWRGSIRATGGYFLQANPSRTARMPAFEVRPPPPPASSSSEQEKRHRRNYLCLPDGIDSIVYWASHETEVASLCPSWRTEVARKDVSNKRMQDDTRAAILWLESWDDALWSTSKLGPSSNPLQVTLFSPQQFDCSLLILVNPLSSNGLFRIGLVRSPGTPEAGPLVTGLVVSGQILGSMVRSTLVNTVCHRSSNSGDTIGANALSRRLMETGAENRPATSAVELLRLASERCY